MKKQWKVISNFAGMKNGSYRVHAQIKTYDGEAVETHDFALSTVDLNIVKDGYMELYRQMGIKIDNLLREKGIIK